MIVPFDKKENAMVLEFKVYDSNEENSLEGTLLSTLKQINEKEYDEELLSRGFAKEKIRHYGFGFKGKKVLIGSE